MKMKEDNFNYFMKICELVASQSKCLSRKVGCIIVKNNNILSTGYNGTPKGYKNCDEGGCWRCKSSSSGQNLDVCYCAHAEINSIINAARFGVNVNGSDLYTTSSPCLECAKAIINANIARVIYRKIYNHNAIKLLIDCDVKLVKI